MDGNKKDFSYMDYIIPRWLQNFSYRHLMSYLPDTLWLSQPEKMPESFKDVIAAASALSFAGVFGYYTYLEYLNGRNNSFISLDPNSAECIEVGRPTTGNFIAGSRGESQPFYWATQNEFLLNTAAYAINLDSYVSK